jgi:feruloyl esterase
MFKVTTLLLFAIQANRLLAASTCEALSMLTVSNTTIAVARSVPAGQFASPSPFRQGTASAPMVPPKLFPAFCRVAGSIKASRDSDIEFEVWMPDSGWNGKMMGVGNGGWAGDIPYDVMGDPLVRGYAVTATDTGHQGGPFDAGFALGHPEKVTDFAWRAVHEMTVKSKAIINAFYGEAPKLSFWNGCSTGGRQGLKEAQQYPSDYNAVIAGAPSNNWTHGIVQALWVAQGVFRDEKSAIPPARIALIHNAVLKICDARDNVVDGVLDDPRRCGFDPSTLTCKGAERPDCLTSSQVSSVRRMYSGAVSTRTRKEVFPGLAFGSEAGWGDFLAPPQVPIAISASYFKFVVFSDPQWDYKTLHVDRDLARADELDSSRINATNTDLKPFFARGGKLLHYHGWSDPQIAAVNSVNYYNSVLSAIGKASLDSSYRLFMMPGMGHCRNGDGPNSFDAITALEQWVEQGRAPERLVASRVREGHVDRTRPLCAWPKVAKYNGTGSTGDETNFTCTAP